MTAQRTTALRCILLNQILTVLNLPSTELGGIDGYAEPWGRRCWLWCPLWLWHADQPMPRARAPDIPCRVGALTKKPALSFSLLWKWRAKTVKIKRRNHRASQHNAALVSSGILVRFHHIHRFCWAQCSPPALPLPSRGYRSAGFSVHANTGFASWEYGNTGEFRLSPTADVELLVVLVFGSHHMVLRCKPLTAAARGGGATTANIPPPSKCLS